MKVGLVLSGGGARGAYEVGVLSYLFEALDPPIGVISGTSVGAINGAYLASWLHEPRVGLSRLIELWTGLRVPAVLGFDVAHASRVPRLLFGGRRGIGMFDAEPMTQLIRAGIDYRQLERNLRSGPLSALTVTATHVGSGRSVCFVAQSPGAPPLTGLSPNVVVRPATILAHHVLASAAIPVIFPPVGIEDELYCDGGLRLNTPLSPAIHLGADRVLVIGLNSGVRAPRAELASGVFPGLPFLLGKVLNAFLLDHVNLDLEVLERTNELLRDAEATYGADFLARLNETTVARGGVPRRIVPAMALRPSRNIGELARGFLSRERDALRRQLGRAWLRVLDVGEGSSSADLASYLLFDGRFARELIELGRRDAAAQHEELARFLDAPERAG